MLDTAFRARYKGLMAQTIMVFDFGTNEEAAQQARHKIERWKQGFRLGDKMTVKFEREETAAGESGSASGEDEGADESGEKKTSKNHKGKKASKLPKEAKDNNEPAGRVRIFVRLGFSDHEKLSQQRWLDRIPAEEPFKSAKGETIRHSDPEFAKSAELFESLD
ncbi:MAG: hypothetical protein ACRD40_04490 [Candidatus Acidiferrales bacterium]